MLTYGAEPWIGAQLDACLSQATTRSFEILVLDSGSADLTLAIARSKGGAVRSHVIANREFGHGRTRNLAASLSSAQYLVLLTQDAVPASNGWLEALLSPLDLDPKVVATFGKQVAPEGCRPAVKRVLEEEFTALSPQDEMIIRTRPAFFSNVNAAYRRDVLLAELPFREVDYAEDLFFAADAATAGLATAYAPAAVVWHAHDYPLRRHYRRVCADAAAAYRAGRGGPAADLWTTFRNALSLTRRDIRFALADPAYSRSTRLRHVLCAPAFGIATSVGLRTGVRDATSS